MCVCSGAPGDPDFTPARICPWHGEGYVPPPGFVDQRERDVFGELIPAGRVGTWSQTATGAKVWSLDPRPEEVNLLDLARGLALECRYGRQMRRRGQFYSVAEHSVIVSQYVPPEYAREALLHDGGEAYGFGDVPRPLKHDPRVRALIDGVEDPWTRAIYARFGIVSTPESRAAIKMVDDLVLVDEIEAVLHSPEMYLSGRHPRSNRLGATIACLDPGAAEYVFLTQFGALFPEHTHEVECLLMEGASPWG